MKSTRAILTLFCTTLVFPATAFGQGSNASATESTDETVVVGEKSLADLRREVWEAEEDFYALFNQLNDERDFNVRCFYEKPTGTRIKNHVCRARFVSKAYSSHAARNRNDLSRVANQDISPAFAAKSAEYEQKMESLIAANPDLQSALIRYNTARADFMALRESTGEN